MNELKATRYIGKTVKASITLAQGEKEVPGTLLGLWQSPKGLQGLVEYVVKDRNNKPKKVKRWVLAENVTA